jgi:hypothetical protein
VKSGLYGVPRGQSMFFVGRTEALSELEEVLTKHTYVSVGASVEGLAGIGKTELALQLVHRLARSGSFPGGIFWLDAELGDLRPAWGGSIADQYGLAAGSIENRCTTLLRAIDGHRDCVLVVLDNVAAWAASERPAPLPSGAHIHFLITTRARNLGGAQFKHIELGTIQPPHDRQLILGLAKRDPAPGVEDLLARLDGYTLALELAGAFLGTYPGETAQSYLNALRQNADVTESAVSNRVRYEATADVLCQAIFHWDLRVDAVFESLHPEALIAGHAATLNESACSPARAVRRSAGAAKVGSFRRSAQGIEDRSMDSLGVRPIVRSLTLR